MKENDDSNQNNIKQLKKCKCTRQTQHALHRTVFYRVELCSCHKFRFCILQMQSTLWNYWKFVTLHSHTVFRHVWMLFFSLLFRCRVPLQCASLFLFNFKYNHIKSWYCERMTVLTMLINSFGIEMKKKKQRFFLFLHALCCRWRSGGGGGGDEDDDAMSVCDAVILQKYILQFLLFGKNFVVFWVHFIHNKAVDMLIIINAMMKRAPITGVESSHEFLKFNCRKNCCCCFWIKKKCNLGKSVRKKDVIWSMIYVLANGIPSTADSRSIFI